MRSNSYKTWTLYILKQKCMTGICFVSDINFERIRLCIIIIFKYLVKYLLSWCHGGCIATYNVASLFRQGNVRELRFAMNVSSKHLLGSCVYWHPLSDETSPPYITIKDNTIGLRLSYKGHWICLYFYMYFMLYL